MKNAYFVSLMTLLVIVGCGRSESPDSEMVDSNATESSGSPGAETHDHATEGPHHGTLIELGNEEFHAELVHDTSSLTIYILDSSATKSQPIDSPELTINLLRDGMPVQYKLAANPDDGDSTGKSSRFRLESSELVESLDHLETAAKLAVQINGKPYCGDIHHSSDHEHGHDH